MVNLDDSSTYPGLDASGMIEHIRAFSAQLLAGWTAGRAVKLGAAVKRVDKIVVAGMGGSAIGGEVVGGLMAAHGGMPLRVHRDYGLPRSVDRKTLVVAISYSGNTGETLSAYGELAGTQALKAVMTSGGKLADLARQDGATLIPISYRSPPRAAFPYMFGALAGFFSANGLLGLKANDLRQASAQLRVLAHDLDIDVPLKSNAAKKLAAEIHGKAPVVYGVGLLAGVARRWKTQFNENSKNWAFFETFPELAHNAIAGDSKPSEAAFFAILLRVPSLGGAARAQSDAVVSLLRKDGLAHRVIEPLADSPLTQVLSTILLGDFTSYYLAMLNGVDPTPLEAVDFVKSRVGKSARRRE